MRFNIKFDLERKWLKILNDQAKWSFLFFTKAGSYLLCAIFIIFLIRVSGVVGNIRSVYTEQVLGIEQQNVTVVSSPDLQYDQDLASSTEVIDMLETKMPDELKENMTKKVKGKENEDNNKTKKINTKNNSQEQNKKIIQ